MPSSDNPTPLSGRTAAVLHLRAAGHQWAETAKLAGFAGPTAAIRAAQRELRRRERAAHAELELVQSLRKAAFRRQQ
ncbi:hypothetical protein [Streptomyces virginiae]|uniref:Uncharacterized protein n=1 Tax=Streptomyces virginiae TaxID=1961 RepID=A0ABZ1TR46_STRVG|nr:hypothetical protein [Streptomyces virginiae]